MTAKDTLKSIQHAINELLGPKTLEEDGIFGPKSRAALEKVVQMSEKPENQPENPWRIGKASSFADPADVAAFKKCKAQGKSDQECFKVGDNGKGAWGADTTANKPMCALPREDWAHLPNPNGTPVLVIANGRTEICTLADTMPAKKNITNGAIIDLNPAAAKAFGLKPPFLVQASWRWA